MNVAHFPGGGEPPKNLGGGVRRASGNSKTWTAILGPKGVPPGHLTSSQSPPWGICWPRSSQG